jgi:Uncharacterized conserved protein
VHALSLVFPHTQGLLAVDWDVSCASTARSGKSLQPLEDVDSSPGGGEGFDASDSDEYEASEASEDGLGDEQFDAEEEEERERRREEEREHHLAEALLLDKRRQFGWIEPIDTHSFVRESFKPHADEAALKAMEESVHAWLEQEGYDDDEYDDEDNDDDDDDEYDDDDDDNEDEDEDEDDMPILHDSTTTRREVMGEAVVAGLESLKKRLLAAGAKPADFRLLICFGG